MAEIFQKIMIFEQKNTIQKCVDQLLRKGYFAFGSDNLYQFLKYAKEIKPDIVIMKLPQNFDYNYEMLNSFKAHLCEEEKCPKIYLNAPYDMADQKFFSSIDLKNKTIDEQLVLSVVWSLKTKGLYLN